MMTTTQETPTEKEDIVELLKEGKSFIRHSLVESMNVTQLRWVAGQLGIPAPSKKTKAYLVRDIFYLLTNDRNRDISLSEKQAWEKRWALATREGQKLTQEQFRCLFMTPLEHAFGFRAYWNGKEAEEQGFHFTGNYNGWSCTSLPTAPVVIRFKDNQQGVLRTLIHEYAHSILHRVGTKAHTLNRNAKEVEAETVAKEVMTQLGVEYHNARYIPLHLEKYRNQHGVEYVCRDEVFACIPALVEALWDVRGYITELPGKHEAEKKKRESKYVVLCPCCSHQWNYKRRAKIIDRDGQGYWCQKCGKENTYNRLQVMERMV